MKKWIPLIILVIALMLFAAYYVISNQVGMPTATVSEGSNPAGFLLGVWQGLIIGLSFIASWFDKNVVLYQVHNSGFWYNFGYIFGLTLILGGSGKASKTNK